ncbi:MAG: hypothetical protein IPG86_08290 [Chitinophagaceae bacterium]|nr:hypothetical protein [Chitinophagaceae bacterium]
MPIRINPYIPFAFIYFFVNAAGLPFGLLYTSLLAPFFYAWVVLKKKQEILFPFLLCLLPFVVAHLNLVGLDRMQYLITMLNLLTVYIYGQAFHTWLKTDQQKERTLRILLYTNALLCGMAILFYFTPLQSLFWSRQNLTSDVTDFLRLKMFTYEPSYYALLFVPLFLYFFLQYVFRQNLIRSSLLLPILFLPFILSFSIGVIICLLAAGFCCLMIRLPDLYRNRRIVNGFINTLFISIALLMFAGIFFPDNPLFIRIENILTGNDSSAEGRTGDAFIIARQLLDLGNPYWGIGAGQLELAGADLIREYYLYYHSTPVAIPNAAAETLALFGWLGFGLRIGIECLLFALTKPWKNYYRLIIFFFVFLYQFTGSYITNAAEYVLWILAFTNAFPAFDVSAAAKRKAAQLLPTGR